MNPKPTREELVKRLVETICQLLDIPIPEGGVAIPGVNGDTAELLRVRDAAKRFGTSESFFYGCKDLPFVLKLPGMGTRVHAGKFRAWLEEETARKAAQTSAPDRRDRELPEWMRR